MQAAYPSSWLIFREVLEDNCLLRKETGRHVSNESISILEKHYGGFLCTHEEIQLLDVFLDFHGHSRELVYKE